MENPSVNPADPTQSPRSWRTLIVSSHPLFGKGLHRVLGALPGFNVQVLAIVSNTEQALQFLETSQPDLVILDYDDEQVNRHTFLQNFVKGERRMRVVLLSLKEGGNQAVVYDRRTLSASMVEAWL